MSSTTFDDSSIDVFPTTSRRTPTAYELGIPPAKGFEREEIVLEGDSLGQRILTVRLEMSARVGRFLSQDAFGELVGAETPEQVPFRGGTVSRWEGNLQEPTIQTCLAITMAARRVGCGIDGGWLMAGEHSAALGPRQRQVLSLQSAPRRRRKVQHQKSGTAS